MNPAEVVIGEVQAVGSPQVLPLLAEGVREPGEAAHLHADREVLALHNRCADSFGVGLPMTGTTSVDFTSAGLRSTSPMRRLKVCSEVRSDGILRGYGERSQQSKTGAFFFNALFRNCPKMRPLTRSSY